MTMQTLVKIICVFGWVFCSFGLLGQSEEKDTLSAAERLFEAAEMLKSEKKYIEAIEKYEEASIAFSNEGNVEEFEKISQTLYNLCRRNSPKNYVNLFEQKIKFCEERYGKRSGQTGLWNLYLGVLHLQLQQLNFANTHLDIARDIFLELEDRPKDIYRVFFMKGNVYLRAFQNEEAIKQYEKGLNLLSEMKAEKIITKDFFLKEQGTIFMNIGIIYKSIEDNDKGIEYFNKALSIFLEKDDLASLAVLYFNLGHMHFKSFNLQIAQEYVQKAIYCREQVFGKDHPSLGASFNFLAIIERKLGNYIDAITYFKKALDLNQKAYGIESPGYQRVIQNLAYTYKLMGNYEEAEVMLRKGIMILKNLPDASGRDLIHANDALSQLWEAQNIKLDSSIILLEESLSISKNIYGERHTLTSSLMNNISAVYLRKEEYFKSLEYAQKALIANTYEFNEKSNFHQNPNLDDFLDKVRGLNNLRNKNNSLLMMWEKDKSNSELKTQIQNCINTNIKLSKNIFKNFGEELNPNPSYYIASKKALTNCMRINFELYQYNQEGKYIEDYFGNMELIKSQQLLLANRKQKAIKSIKIPHELIAKEKYLSEQINSLEQLIYTASKTNDSIIIDSIQNESLFEAKRNREIFISELETKYPKYYQLKYDFKHVELAELKKYLNENMLYLELSIGDNDVVDDKSLYLLALTNQEEHIFKTDLIHNYAKKITTFNKLLRSHNLLRADRRRKFIELSNELYNQFIQPIEHLLEGKDRLVIVGEGVTHYLPFETLLKSKEDKPWHELDFLIHDHEISYHYSGTLFARTQAQEKEFENELLAFAPVFSEGESTLTALREGGLFMADSTFRSVEGDHFSPLPHSEKEIKSIQQLFPKSSNVNILLNEDANESNLKSALEQNHRYAHIASHSFANIDFPKFSGIACSNNTDSTAINDGILYVGEIYNLAVNSDLVILSSCESGVGKLLGGEGMLGLNRSFVYAGVPNVIFSLWKVYDEATGQMMTEFYKNTLDGQSYSTALRTAKLKMLENPATAVPDIWAAFLLVGR